MRIQLLVNGSVRCTAQCPAPGYLNAHLNLAELAESDGSSKTVSMRATQIADTESTGLRWPEISLETGDVAELRVLSAGESDAPSEIRRSREDPSNLFSDFELAKELSEAVSVFTKQLMDILPKAKGIEPPDEYKKIQQAIGSVIYGTGSALLFPIFRRHSALVPEEMKGGIL